MWSSTFNRLKRIPRVFDIRIEFVKQTNFRSGIQESLWMSEKHQISYSHVDRLATARELVVDAFSVLSFHIIKSISVKAYAIENIQGTFFIVVPYGSDSLEPFCQYNLSFRIKLDITRDSKSCRCLLFVSGVSEKSGDNFDLEVRIPSTENYSGFECNQFLGIAQSNKCKRFVSFCIQRFRLLCEREMLKKDIEIDDQILFGRKSKNKAGNDLAVVAILPDADGVDWMNDSEDEESVA